MKSKTSDGGEPTILLSRREIGVLFGVTSSAVGSWLTRYPNTPAPAAFLDGNPGWLNSPETERLWREWHAHDGPGRPKSEHDRRYRTSSIVLSSEASAVIAGVLADAQQHEVNPEDIVVPASVWEEIWAAFPISIFHEWARENTPFNGTRGYRAGVETA